MNSIQKIIKYINDTDYRFLVNTYLGLYHRMPDEQFLKKKFKAKVGYALNLNAPETFNEKLQWLKLHDRNPLYTRLVDKYEVKEYVSRIIGESYIIPTLGVWDKFEEIDFSTLPEQFVLKCSHDSGGVFICKDKRNFNRRYAKKRIQSCLKKNYFWVGREWPYKNVRPRIIAEKYLELQRNCKYKIDSSNDELNDYKFMCFDGKVEIIFVCSERFSKDGLKVTFFDTEWNRLPFTRHYLASSKIIPKPKMLNQMIQIAEKLSKGFSFLRVDLFEVEGKIYFGELTLYPGNGFEEFKPNEWDYKLGKLINLSLAYNKDTL